MCSCDWVCGGGLEGHVLSVGDVAMCPLVIGGPDGAGTSMVGGPFEVFRDAWDWLERLRIQWKGVGRRDAPEGRTAMFD